MTTGGLTQEDQDNLTVFQASMERYQEPLNPVDCEAAMRATSNYIARGVRIVDAAEAAYQDADRAFDRAFALAYLEHEGPQTEKKYAAEVATLEQRTTRDVAHQAYMHAKRVAKSLEDHLSMLQSVNRSILMMYAQGQGG